MVFFIGGSKFRIREGRSSDGYVGKSRFSSMRENHVSEAQHMILSEMSNFGNLFVSDK